MIIKGVPLAGITRHVAIRPAWALGRVGAQNKPTQAQVGAWNIFTMPVYSSDDEELFWHIHIPGRWDGVSDIQYSLWIGLGAAGGEDVGDKFKFQVQWDWAGPTRAFSATPAETLPVEELVATGRTARYSVYKLDYTFNYDVTTPACTQGAILAGRVIRIASASPAVASSPYILDHVVNFQIDRAYKV